MWVDSSIRARQLARSAILNWDSWTDGARRGWCHEADKLPKKYRKIVWVTLSVSRGWREMKAVHDFYRSVVDEPPEADPAIFEKDPAVDEQDMGRKL